MTIAVTTRKVTKRSRNNRTPVLVSAGSVVSGGGGTSGGGTSGSYANLITENVFNEDQFFKKDIFLKGGVYIGDYDTSDYVSLTNTSTNVLISSAETLTVLDYDIKRESATELSVEADFRVKGILYGDTSIQATTFLKATSYLQVGTNIKFNDTVTGKELISFDSGAGMKFQGDLYVDGDMNIQGTIYSYSQDEINVGDSWFNLGVADVVGQDGGLRMYSDTGTTIMSTWYYATTNDRWGTDSDGYFGGDFYTDSIKQYTVAGLTVFAEDGIHFQTTSGTDIMKWSGNAVQVYKTIGTDPFSSGFAGSGWRVDNNTNTATFDYLTVRKTMRIYELEINKIRASNGSLWVSDAVEVTTVITIPEGYEIYVDNDGGNLAIPFIADDIIRCQRWTGSGVKYYETKIASIDASGDFFTTSDTGYSGTDYPAAGDTVVRTGSTSVTSRQGAIYLTSSDDNAPFIDILDGYNTVGGNVSDNSTYTKVRLGRLDGITDTDAGLSGTQTNYYGLYSDNVHLKGTIYSNAGTIAGWTLSTTNIEKTLSGYPTVWMGADKNSPTDAVGFGVWTDSSNYVRMVGWSNGHSYLQGAVEGNMYFNLNTYSTCSIAGWSFDNSALYTGTKDTSGYTSGGITISSGGSIHSKNFYIDTSGNVFAQDAFFDNVDVVGRIATNLTALRISANTSTMMYYTSNNYQIIGTTAGSYNVDLSITITNKPKNGQIFRFISGGHDLGETYRETNIGLYCSDGSLYIKKKDGSLATSIATAVWIYDHQNNTTSNLHVISFMYVEDTDYFIEL